MTIFIILRVKLMFIKCLSVLLFYNTVTSHLFTHIVSTEIVGKDREFVKMREVPNILTVFDIASS